MSSPRPFSLHVPDEDIADLRARLARTRFPDQAPEAPWTYGADRAYMRKLVDYWREKFDWRAQEARLNAFPQFKVALHGIDLPSLGVLAIKAKNQFRAAFTETFRTMIDSDIRGPVMLDFNQLPYKNGPKTIFPFNRGSDGSTAGRAS